MAHFSDLGTFPPLDTLATAIDNIANVAPAMNAAELVDTLARVNGAIKRLEEICEAGKKQLGGYWTEENTIDGVLFRARLVSSVRWTLDQKGLKEEYGEQWFTAHSRQQLVSSVRFSAR
jgi:hypothetical protein